MSETAKRLKALGIVLPKPAAPVANYVPTTRAGSLLFVSGQLPFGPDGKLAERHIGKLSAESPVVERSFTVNERGHPASSSKNWSARRQLSSRRCAWH